MNWSIPSVGTENGITQIYTSVELTTHSEVTLYLTALGFITGKAFGVYAHPKLLISPIGTHSGIKGLAINSFYIVEPTLIVFKTELVSCRNTQELNS